MSSLNQPVGGGDHLVSEALYFNDPKVMVLKSIKIALLVVGNGRMALLKWILLKLMHKI